MVVAVNVHGTSSSGNDRTPMSRSASGPALAALKVLPIKGRAPKTGYARIRFGPPWSDDVTVPLGHNGCDTRDDILRLDLIDPQFKAGTNNCVVLSENSTTPTPAPRSSGSAARACRATCKSTTVIGVLPELRRREQAGKTPDTPRRARLSPGARPQRQRHRPARAVAETACAFPHFDYLLDSDRVRLRFAGFWEM